MTYQKLFDLKFNKKVPTIELQKYFPKEAGKIGAVALAELPVKTLRQLISDGKKLRQLLELKAEFRKRKTHS